MIAAVTQRVVQDHRYGEVRDSLSHEWYDFLNAAGFEIVLPIPNRGQSIRSWIKKIKPDLIVLSGGNDVEYGQLSLGTPDRLSQLRDETDAALLDVSCSDNIPILGVCRGMQFIYAYFGGQLVKREGHAGTSHEIKYRVPNVSEEDWKTAVVNSYHHYCIGNNLPDGLLSIGNDIIDGTVEALIHQDYPLLGVMWHPERNKPYLKTDTDWIKIVMKKRLRRD
jgi:gamma-glutamyl-gamma-aminobutyrate hydrolase PuuD